MISNVFINDGGGKAGTTRNLQIMDVIRAMMESEHCLFNNKDENLMHNELVEDCSTDES
jgi:hypothetical protein